MLSQLAKWPENRSPRTIALVATAGVFFISWIEFLSGNEISWSVAYVLPIGLAAWYAGAGFGYLLAALSAVLLLVIEFADGPSFVSWHAHVWNSTIKLTFYCAFVGLLSYIRTLTDNLASKVRVREADVARLERELLEVGERERRRIGSDLHDGLGQHLTGTSLAAQVLKRQLMKRGSPEVEQVTNVIALLEQSIAVSHKLAKGLQPVDLHAGGLMQALQEFAKTASELFKVSCTFKCDAPIPISDIAVAEQLYRIAQEATSNAVKHGRAANIVLCLEADDDGTILRISDDGIGFASPTSKGSGLGLRIMAERAKLIHARFNVNSRPGNGTVICCKLPQTSLASKSHA
jgi:signal transduction histidine kinase